MTENSWRIVVDGAVCTGSGLCEAIAPAVFRVEGGQAHLTQARVTPDDTVREAVGLCPNGALALFDAAGEPVEG